MPPAPAAVVEQVDPDEGDFAGRIVPAEIFVELDAVEGGHTAVDQHQVAQVQVAVALADASRLPCARRSRRHGGRTRRRSSAASCSTAGCSRPAAAVRSSTKFSRAAASTCAGAPKRLSVRSSRRRRGSQRRASPPVAPAVPAAIRRAQRHGRAAPLSSKRRMRTAHSIAGSVRAAGCSGAAADRHHVEIQLGRQPAVEHPVRRGSRLRAAPGCRSRERAG
jgi:hypothetical protein